MLEIILNPDVEIKNDKDRELYLQFRQLFDTKMLVSIKGHSDKEDHLFSTCMNERVLQNQVELKQFVDSYSQHKPARDVLSDLLYQLSVEMSENFVNMLAVVKEAQRRGIILTTSRHKD